MARVAFPLVLQSPSSGSAIVGATATITQHVVGGSLGSGPAATIYTSETGVGVTGTNQIQTDSNGRWTQGSGSGFAQYWLPEGTYDIAITGPGLTGYTITRELACATDVAHHADTGWITANQLSGQLALGAGVNQPGTTVKTFVDNPGTVGTSSFSFAGLGDAVNITLDTDGLLAVWYQAIWQETVAGATQIALFLGGNQIKIADATLGAPVPQAAAIRGGATTSVDRTVCSCALGLVTHENVAYSGDVTTGQVVGQVTGASTNLYHSLNGAAAVPATVSSSAAGSGLGGPCYIFAAAGNYQLEVRQKVSSGGMIIHNRRLWVQAIDFNF